MSPRPLKVALIMGGTSSEREVSLASRARRCAKAMQELPHQVEVFDPAGDLPRLMDSGPRSSTWPW